MKRAGNKRFDDFPAAKLYLDDLKAILDILEEHCGRVEIRTGDFDEISPAEVDELVAKLGVKRFSDIFIKAYDPYITIDLRTFGVSAYISEDELTQHGIVSKLREKIEHRRKRYFGTFTNIVGMLPMAGMGVAIATSEWALALMCFGLTVLLIWPIVKYQMAHKIVVLTTSKANEESFLTRRKDDIAVAVGSALIGAIVSFVLVKYFGQA